MKKITDQPSIFERRYVATSLCLLILTLFPAVTAAPLANFTAQPRSGTAPLTVNFSDASVMANITSWAWDFNNDGSMDSTQQNPVFTYNARGNYSVKLTVRNATTMSSQVKSKYVTVSAPPIPPVSNFSGTPTTGNVPLMVQFSDLSRNKPTSWAWDFNNDGITDNTTQNPLYSYTAPGNYSVKLTVSNSAGSDSRIRSKYIKVLAVVPISPVANFTSDIQSGAAPLNVNFTDASTGDGISAWAWDFENDGTKDSTDQNPSHIYNTTGNFTVSLTVTNDGGSNSTVEADYITVSDPAPVALPGYAYPPTDPDGDGVYEDLNGNGYADFNDVVVFYVNLEWIQNNEPVSLFDFNGNGLIDFDDVVIFFDEL